MGDKNKFIRRQRQESACIKLTEVSAPRDPEEGSIRLTEQCKILSRSQQEKKPTMQQVDRGPGFKESQKSAVAGAWQHHVYRHVHLKQIHRAFGLSCAKAPTPFPSLACCSLLRSWGKKKLQKFLDLLTRQNYIQQIGHSASQCQRKNQHCRTLLDKKWFGL